MAFHVVYSMARCLTALRAQVESALAGRFPSPFTFSDSNIVETVSTGIPEADGLTGGLPQGGITEICGPSCSGRTSLLMSALASRTGAAEVCALLMDATLLIRLPRKRPVCN